MFAFFELYFRASKALGNFIIGLFVNNRNWKNRQYGETPLHIQKIQYAKYVQGLDL